MEFDNSSEFNITKHCNLFTERTCMDATYFIVYHGCLVYVIRSSRNLEPACSLAQGVQQCYLVGERGGRDVRVPAHDSPFPRSA
jgi:hypothetical protein